MSNKAYEITKELECFECSHSLSNGFFYVTGEISLEVETWETPATWEDPAEREIESVVVQDYSLIFSRADESEFEPSARDLKTVSDRVRGSFTLEDLPEGWFLTGKGELGKGKGGDSPPFLIYQWPCEGRGCDGRRRMKPTRWTSCENVSSFSNSFFACFFITFLYAEKVGQLGRLSRKRKRK